MDIKCYNCSKHDTDADPVEWDGFLGKYLCGACIYELGLEEEE